MMAVKPQLFYDGACPLCKKEMCLLETQKEAHIELIDIHSLDSFIGLPSKKMLLQNLHLKTASGEWLIGLDANIAAWAGTPYARRWSLLKLPLLYQAAKFVYYFWARVRYSTRYS